MSIYKLYASTIGDGAANLDIIANGRIEGVYFSGYTGLSADADSFEAEVSFSSSSGFTTNDTKSSIACVRQEVELVTSGEVQNALNVFVGPLDIPVTQGERIYLHTARPAGTPSPTRMSVYIYVADSVGSARRVRL